MKCNWKWILKYAVCDTQERVYNCCLSIKHTQSINCLLMNKKSNGQYYHLHYHCITFAALTRLDVQGKQVSFFFIFLSFIVSGRFRKTRQRANARKLGMTGIMTPAICLHYFQFGSSKISCA
jgi:hypothetical protein